MQLSEDEKFTYKFHTTLTTWQNGAQKQFVKQ